MEHYICKNIYYQNIPHIPFLLNVVFCSMLIVTCLKLAIIISHSTLLTPFFSSLQCYFY